MEAGLAKQKKDVTRLTTELVNASAHNAELYRDLNTTRKDLTTAQAAVREARKSFYEIRGAVSNMTFQTDDAVRTAVETVRLRVDRIHNPFVPTPSTAPGGVQGT